MYIIIPLTLYDGSHSYKEWYTIYAHMKNIKVDIGEQVDKGDVIGYISNTNYQNDAKMAKHLHFAITTRLNIDNNGKAGSFHYAYSYAKDKDALKAYSDATISPNWLKGSYRNVNYASYSSDAADISALKRITEDTSRAPASTYVIRK